jgi:hypothetical protein
MRESSVPILNLDLSTYSMKAEEYADFEEFTKTLSTLAVVVHDLFNLFLRVVLFVASDHEKYHL